MGFNFLANWCWWYLHSCPSYLYCVWFYWHVTFMCFVACISFWLLCIFPLRLVVSSYIQNLWVISRFFMVMSIFLIISASIPIQVPSIRLYPHACWFYPCLLLLISPMTIGHPCPWAAWVGNQVARAAPRVFWKPRPGLFTGHESECWTASETRPCNGKSTIEMVINSIFRWVYQRVLVVWIVENG